MSYILDALRKADAQRERDPSRGIHAQAAAAPSHAPARNARWIAWPIAGAVVVAAAAYVGWQPRPARPLPSVPASGFVMEAPRAPAVIPIPVANAVVPPAPPPLPAPAAAERPLVKAAAPATVLKSPPAVVASVAPQAAAAAAAAPAPAPADAAAPERIVAVAELPADVQRELPKLAIAGGVHSENAAQRMLIVGGQVKAEGAELAPGVVLEQIRARTAVLRFKGFRYSVPY